MGDDVNVQLARIDERTQAMERRLARLEAVFLAGLLAVVAVVGKSLFAGIGLAS